MLTQKDFETLFGLGLIYRYPIERWKELFELGGLPFAPPRRVIEIGGMTYIDELIQPILTPAILSSGEASQLTKLAIAWEKLALVQLDLARRAVSGNVRKDLAQCVLDLIPEDEKQFVNHDPGYSIVMPFIRLDCTRVEGLIKVLDINSTRPAGVGDIDVIDSLYSGAYGRQLLMASSFVEVVRRCWFEWCENCRGNKTPARIAIVVSPVEADWHNFANVAKMLSSQDWVEVAEMTEDVPDQSDARYNFVMRSRIKTGHSKFVKFASLPVDRFCAMSPPYRRFLGDKRWFVILQDKRFIGYFREALGEHFNIISNTLPLTCPVEHGIARMPNGENVEAVTLPKSQWIVKPSAGSSAKGILVGRSTSKYIWDDMLARANKGTILQQFFRVQETGDIFDEHGSPTTMEGYIKLGAYLYGGEFSACEYMLRHGALVHGSRDCAWSICRIKDY